MSIKALLILIGIFYRTYTMEAPSNINSTQYRYSAAEILSLQPIEQRRSLTLEEFLEIIQYMQQHPESSFLSLSDTKRST